MPPGGSACAFTASMPRWNTRCGSGNPRSAWLHADGRRAGMSVVAATTKIAAPCERVWDVVMDPKRLREWVTIHRKLVHADEGPPHVGFEMDQRIHLRGVSLDVHWRLVECKPGARAVWEGRGPARSRARTEYVLSREKDETRFDYRNEFHPRLGTPG